MKKFHLKTGLPKLRALPLSALPLLAVSLWAAPSSAAPHTIGISGTTPDFKTVEVDSDHVYDYTFTTAPTDWWVQSGIWEMTNRWSCSPQWSWFGGRSEEIAAVWNKRKFEGEQSIQFYFAFKMGLAGTPRWNYHPSDVALSFCADGKNLGSGYALIIAADNNSHSVLLRQGTRVAESSAPEALLPTLTDGNPDLNVIHRHWWYVRVNKIGSKVECWLENKLLFTYDDPKPLDLGQMAIWTYNNGIMLSRVQVYYEREVRPAYVKSHASMLAAIPSVTASVPGSATSVKIPIKVALR